MRHLDEGQLHEYLDMTERDPTDKGDELNTHTVEEHLAACADCRTLFEEVKAVRARSSEILAASDPGAVDMPSFADIRARAEARKQPRRVLQYMRMKQLAWAATVVLAVAVGWYARGGFRSIAVQRATEEQAPTSMVAAAPVEQETDEAISQVADRAAEERPQQGALEQEGQAAERERSAPPEQVASKSEVPQAATRVAAAAPQPATDPSARRDEPVQLAAEPQAAAGRGAPQPIDTVVDTRQVIGAVDSTRASYTGARRAQAQVVSAENLAARDQLELREGEIRDPSVWAVSVTDWTVTDASGAADALGEPVPTIREVPVVDYGIAGDDVLSAVRVRQQLETGDVVELILVRGSRLHLLTDVAAVAQGKLTVRNETVGTDGVNVVFADWGELSVLLRGAVEIGLLRELVAMMSGQ